MGELRKIVQGTLLENEPMSNHTSYGIGGPADAYITPKDRYDLAEILISFVAEEGGDWNAYKKYTPKKVMEIFKRVFLD